MLSKNHAKIVKSLRQKKNRLEHRLFLAEGEKVVSELLASEFMVKMLFTTDDNYAARHLESVRISPREMEQISTMTTPPGVLAVAGMPTWYAVEPLASLPEKTQYVLALDGINDPGNMGTLIRTALWFGFDMVLASPDCVDCFNPKVVQSSMGAVFKMPVYTIDFSAPPDCGALGTFGLDLNGENLFTASLGAGVYVLGSESHGLREHARSFCQRLVTIPGSGAAESLNAAVSASIVMAELMRRRLA
jgi:TrmH family RNA methyltransferase